MPFHSEEEALQAEIMERLKLTEFQRASIRLSPLCRGKGSINLKRDPPGTSAPDSVTFWGLFSGQNKRSLS
jgi:hypothetical protein